MRSAIPNYSTRAAPLQAALAKVFEEKSRRSKKAAAEVSLLHLWGQPYISPLDYDTVDFPSKTQSAVNENERCQ
jgi:ProSAAS precursor